VTVLLLDTHVVLWWLSDDPRLGTGARDAIGGSPQAYVSAASTWEVAIKIAIGKLELDLPADTSFGQLCAEQGFTLAPVTHEDAWSIRDLPATRTDPFDRLIAGSARTRGWTVVTADPAFDAFDVPTMDAG